MSILILGAMTLTLRHQSSDPPPTPAPTPAAKAPEVPKDGNTLPIKPKRKIEFTTTEGTWMSLDLSPDQKTVVFELLGDLYTMPIEGGEAKAIVTGSGFDSMPRFSPDGKKILFVSDRSGADNLWTVDADGTNAKALTTGRNTHFLSPTWSPDGRYVVASKGSGYLPIYKLVFIDTKGGPGTTIGLPQGRTNSMGATFSPDGNSIYFSMREGAWTYDAQFPMWQVYKLDRLTGKSKSITGALGSAMRPMITPDGKSLIYATREKTQTGLVLRDLKTNEERWLAFPIDRDDQESRATRDTIPGYAITKDGKSLIINLHGKIQRIDIATGQNTPIPFTAKVNQLVNDSVYFEHKVNESPMVRARFLRDAVVSPDGTRVAFRAFGRLWTQELKDGAKPVRVTKDDQTEFSPSWSPDGKSLAYATWGPNGGAVYRANVETGETTRLTWALGTFNSPTFTPDGKQIIFSQGSKEDGLDTVIHIDNHKCLEKTPEEMLADRLREIGGRGPIGTSETKIMSVYGGDPQDIAIEDALQFTFVKGSNRLYYSSFSGVGSARLDGYDQRDEVRLGGSFPVLSPTGNHVLAATGTGKLYVLDRPLIGGPTPLATDFGPFSSKVITAEGNESPQWSAQGDAIYWTQGSKLFRQALNEEKPKVWDITIEQPRAVAKGNLLLRGARVITMKGDQVIEKGDILVVNNRVQAVGAQGSFAVPEGTTVMDMRGKTISPGYVDVHSHWFGNDALGYPQSWGYLANLAFGVTTNRDPQSGSTGIYEFADSIESGSSIGPRIYTTGPGVFSGTPSDTKAEAVTYLKRYSEAYQTWFIKQYVAGDRLARQNIALACQELGLTPTTEGALEVKMALTEIMDGYSGHEHALPLIPLNDDMAQFLARTKTYYTPTLLVTYGGPFGENYYFHKELPANDPRVQKFIPPRLLDNLVRRRDKWFMPEEYVFDKVAASCAKVVRAGGRVCLGSHGEFQGMGAHWEIWSFVSGGMTPLEALRCATIFGAEAIGLHKQLGSVEPGKFADLVVYDKNPLENIRNTTSIAYVVKDGFVYEGGNMDQVWPTRKPRPKAYWETGRPGITIKP
jgi:Tol biopolymer transport system component